MASDITKKKIKVTVKGPDIPPSTKYDGPGTVVWEVKLPYRMFEGDVRFYANEHGSLSIFKGDPTAMRTDIIILFAHGQWVSAEYV